MRTRGHNALITVMALFVTLLTTISFTITAYTSNPLPSQGQLTTGHDSLEPTTTPMLLEPATILSHTNSLRRLQALPAIEKQPTRASRVRLQDTQSAFRAPLAREYKLLEPMSESIEQAPLRLPERYKRDQLEDRYRSTREVRQGHQNTHKRSRPATTCTVTTPADNGAGSLRQCLLDATPNDTINFDPQTFPPATPATISLLSALPWITTDGLTIDGSNTGVVLDGSGLSEGTGFVVDAADGVTIQGLQIINFPWDGIALISGASNAIIGGENANARNVFSENAQAGVVIASNGTTGNQVLGNYIGTDASGTGSQPNGAGIVIALGAQNNIIGGASGGNLVSGNTVVGIQLQQEGTTGNQVLGNYIGTDASGTASLSNGTGIVIGFGAQNNIIGSPSAGNLISGNTEAGIWLQNEGTSGNQMLGNYIGTDTSGTASLSNSDGVVIIGNAQNNVIGGQSKGARNLISGNIYTGINLQNEGTTGNQVLGNYIGTDASGTASLGNFDGVVIRDSAQNNIIGGAGLAHNLISGNAEVGIYLQDEGTNGNQVLGNYIGTDLTGTASLSNRLGVLIGFGAQNNVIGSAFEGNVISGNTDVGIQLQDEGTSGNQVLGNYIGTDASGTASLGNGTGVFIVRAQDNVIGGVSGGNLISGNTEAGILISGEGTTGNQVLGNYIGTNLTGTVSRGNGVGVAIGFAAQNNIVGGESQGERNLISGNTQAGIQLQDEGTSGNQVLGNYIGTNLTGAASLGNRWGVLIGFAAQDNVVGGTSARNLISGNTDVGILLQNEGTSGNQVLGNYIGTDASGTASLGNRAGVVIGLAQDNVIGGAGLAGNLVSGNTEVGIQLQSEGTTGNQVLGNYIGTDASGTASLGNRLGVGIGFGAQDNVVGGTGLAGNLISGNTGVGLVLQDKGTSGNQVLGNYIGTDAAGSQPLGNEVNGVHLVDGATLNTIGISNTIAYNGSAGVLIDGETTLGNTITRNIIRENGGLPIDFINVIEPPPSPILQSYSLSDHILSGSACANCRVEIFANPISEPNGTIFLDEITVDAKGTFTATITAPPNWPYLSATVTDLQGNTSAFSAGFCMTCPTPTPTNTPINTPTATNTPTGTSTTIQLYLPIVVR